MPTRSQCSTPGASWKPARTPSCSRAAGTMRHCIKCNFATTRADPGNTMAFEPVLTSTLTCPACGGTAEEAMPLDACIYFYDCPHCGALLRPREGDCCVFCSYGSVACPPRQSGTCVCGPHAC